MNSQALARFAGFCKSKDISFALLSNPATIAWLTGYSPPIQTGPNPFEGGPALGWWRGEELTLVLSDGEVGAARSLGVQARDYVGYTIDGPAVGFRNQGSVLKELLCESSGSSGNIGIELDFLPAALLGTVKEALPSAFLTPLDGSFDLLRAVKTSEEVEKIRAALALCDLAQAETRRMIQPGISELELWTKVKGKLEVAAGCRLPVLADFIAGARTADIGGLPGGYELRAGDALIADIVPRLNGYWGDNCGTHFVGEPASQLRKAFDVVLGALRLAIASVRPGLRACDLDVQLRRAIQDGGYSPYPHHSGHGLGTTYHEEPRIIPSNKMELQPGMVIALEPGVYMPQVGGVRLEDVILVTEDGCELLTRHLAGS